MGNGRVIDDKPDSLKMISFFDHIQEETDEEPLIQDLKKIGNNSEKVINRLRSLLKNNLPDKYKNYEFRNNKNEKGKVEVIPSASVQAEDQNQQQNGIQRVHTDGILLDYGTGELIYYIAFGDAVDINKITEGAEVSFEDEYKGICEVILHNKLIERDGKSINIKIDTDKDYYFEETKTVVVRFVELKGNPNQGLNVSSV